MSMKTSIIYGYGVDMNVNYVEFPTVMSFFKNHLPKEYEQMLSEAKSDGIDIENLDEEFEDWVCDYANNNYGSASVDSYYSIISYIMRKETDINIDDIRSDEDWAIMHPETHPWYMNETEKNLTEEELCEIFKKYFAELGVEIEPDYVRVESFG